MRASSRIEQVVPFAEPEEVIEPVRSEPAIRSVSFHHGDSESEERVSSNETPEISTTSLPKARMAKLIEKHRLSIVQMAKEMFIAASGPHFGPEGEALTDEEAYQQHRLERRQGNTPGALRAAAAALVFAIRIQSTTFTLMRKSGSTLKNFNNAAFALAIAGIVMMVIENEIYHDGYYGGTFVSPWEMTSNILRCMMSVSSVALVIIIWKTYLLRVQLLRMNKLLDGITLWSSDMFWECVAECCICIVHIPPFVNFTFTLNQTGLIGPALVEYDIHLFGLLMLLRIYLFGRWVKDHSRMFQASARLLTALNKVDLTFGFVMKTVFRRHPLLSLFSIIAGNLLISSYCLYITERPVSPELNFSDALWLLFIAMATVGFGDIVPQTYPGRLVVVICVLVGLVSTALLVAIVHDRLALTDFEWRIYHILQIGSARKDVRHYAAKTIQVFWRKRARTVEHYRMLQRWRHARRSLQSIEKEVAFGPTLFEVKNSISTLRTSIQNSDDHRRRKLSLSVKRMTPEERDEEEDVDERNLKRLVEPDLNPSDGKKKLDTRSDVCSVDNNDLKEVNECCCGSTNELRGELKQSLAALATRVTNMEIKLDTVLQMMTHRKEKRVKAHSRTVYNVTIDTKTETNTANNSPKKTRDESEEEEEEGIQASSSIDINS